jgi:hypothetical protein
MREVLAVDVHAAIARLGMACRDLRSKDDPPSTRACRNAAVDFELADTDGVANT